MSQNCLDPHRSDLILAGTDVIPSPPVDGVNIGERRGNVKRIFSMEMIRDSDRSVANSRTLHWLEKCTHKIKIYFGDNISPSEYKNRNSLITLEVTGQLTEYNLET